MIHDRAVLIQTQRLLPRNRRVPDGQFGRGWRCTCGPPTSVRLVHPRCASPTCATSSRSGAESTPARTFRTGACSRSGCGRRRLESALPGRSMMASGFPDPAGPWSAAASRPTPLKFGSAPSAGVAGHHAGIQPDPGRPVQRLVRDPDTGKGAVRDDDHGPGPPPGGVHRGGDPAQRPLPPPAISSSVRHAAGTEAISPKNSS